MKLSLWALPLLLGSSLSAKPSQATVGSSASAQLRRFPGCLSLSTSYVCGLSGSNAMGLRHPLALVLAHDGLCGCVCRSNVEKYYVREDVVLWRRGMSSGRHGPLSPGLAFAGAGLPSVEQRVHMLARSVSVFPCLTHGWGGLRSFGCLRRRACALRVRGRQHRALHCVYSWFFAVTWCQRTELVTRPMMMMKMMMHTWRSEHDARKELGCARQV